MNDFQREQIWTMRTKGLGYGEISRLIGLSKDSVKKFCQRHPELRGVSHLPQMMIKERVEQGTHCPQCFQPMERKGRGRPKKFCSSLCRKRWWLAHPEEHNQEQTAYETRTCHYCGRSFLSYASPNRKYCSHACYIQERFYEGDVYDSTT